jgi:hypothetical protein
VIASFSNHKIGGLQRQVILRCDLHYVSIASASAVSAAQHVSFSFLRSCNHRGQSSLIASAVLCEKEGRNHKFKSVSFIDMSQTETTNGKRDTSSGDLTESYMFIRDLFSYLSRVSVKGQSKNKDNYQIEWILALIRLWAIPYIDTCVETVAGYRRLYDLQPETFFMIGNSS